jgi:hypothetical protein
MASKIELYNLIAGHLGQDEVLSFPASGPLGDAIEQFWDAARQRTLRANTWHSARKRMVLTPTTTPPAFGYTYAFNLPGDFIRVVEVGVSGFGEFRDYVREGQQLLSNSTPLNLIYIFDQAEIDFWDGDLAMAFSIMVAAMAAVKITGDASLKQMLEQQFEREYEQVTQADGMEDPPLTFAEDNWINARWAGGYGYPGSGYQ